MRIDVWSDVVCPWCYLGTRRLERAIERTGLADRVEVTHRSFQLDPSAPTDRTELTADVLARRYGLSPEQVAAAQAQMQQRAAADDLEFHLDGQRTGNTLAAHRLLHLARERGVQAVLVERLFRAYFTDGGSVFDADPLQRLAVETGLDAAEVADVLAGDRYADAVEADLEQAREYGIQGVPFVVLDRRFAVSGAQSVEVFEQALERAMGTAVAD